MSRKNIIMKKTSSSWKNHNHHHHHHHHHHRHSGNPEAAGSWGSQEAQVAGGAGLLRVQSAEQEGREAGEGDGTTLMHS
jgi:hypothetical protein